VSALPGSLQPIARVLPTTRVFAAGRTVLAGHPLPWGQIGWAAVGAVVTAAASVWWLRRSLAAFRARGSISRHV
jgi:ABC-2 type transport system permease protein